jgi:hypothetical protein
MVGLAAVAGFAQGDHADLESLQFGGDIRDANVGARRDAAPGPGLKPLFK